MSDEYYLAEAKAKIDLICEEAKWWDDAWSRVIKLWLLMAALIAFGSVMVLFHRNGSWGLCLLCAAIEIFPAFYILDARDCRARRSKMYSEQMDRAIAWRDELQRRIRGF